MAKHYSIFLLALIVLFGACGCEKPKSQDEPQNGEADLTLIKQSVVIDGDCLWSGKPQITVHIENPNEVTVRLGVKAKLSTDKKEQLEEVADSVDVPAKSEIDHVLTTEENLKPGFYRAACFVGGKSAGSVCFGIDVFDIVSAPDMQADYTAYWEGVKAQLAAIPMDAHLIEMPEMENNVSKTYLVELKSVPDGLTGEPVTVRGYYCEPKDGKKHPVLMHFYGYDTQGTTAHVDCPQGWGSYAEFYLSHRGQYINNRPESSREPDGLGDLENIYGDWFSYHFGDKDSYYYRGAFMDAIRAVDFMATREVCDMTKLFAEGSSQGGALTYAAAALSNYPFSAICTNVAFLGDFPDYFELVGWPGDVAKAEAQKKGMTDEQMYAFLSYYDTKNLATRISCPVLATSGGRDGTCPPHTNIAPYNVIKNPDKEYHFYPEMTHDYPKDWWNMIERFFQKHL